MGYKVTREQNLRLKQFEKEFGEDIAFKIVQSGFEYGNWGIIKANNTKTDIEIVNAHWEFIPTWIQDKTQLAQARKQGIPWLNATSEKLLSSKMFRYAALHHRCLIPVSWFFEWRHFTKPTDKKVTKYPYKISVTNNDYFYLAGIYQPYTNFETGKISYCFAIVTTKANSIMEQIHNVKKRMPTILTDDLALQWIMGNLTENEIESIASFKIDSSKINAQTIHKDFRLAQHSIDEFIYDDLPALKFD